MTKQSYAVVRAANSEDDAEAFGPLTSSIRAYRLVEGLEYINPGYGYYVVELYPVRDAERQIANDA